MGITTPRPLGASTKSVPCSLTQVQRKRDPRRTHRIHRPVQLLQRVAVVARRAVEAGTILLVRVLGAGGWMGGKGGVGWGGAGKGGGHARRQFGGRERAGPSSSAALARRTSCSAAIHVTPPGRQTAGQRRRVCWACRRCRCRWRAPPPQSWDAAAAWAACPVRPLGPWQPLQRRQTCNERRRRQGALGALVARLGGAAEQTDPINWCARQPRLLQEGVQQRLDFPCWAAQQAAWSSSPSSSTPAVGDQRIAEAGVAWNSLTSAPGTQSQPWVARLRSSGHQRGHRSDRSIAVDRQLQPRPSPLARHAGAGLSHPSARPCCRGGRAAMRRCVACTHALLHLPCRRRALNRRPEPPLRLCCRTPGSMPC